MARRPHWPSLWRWKAPSQRQRPLLKHPVIRLLTPVHTMSFPLVRRAMEGVPIDEARFWDEADIGLASRPESNGPLQRLLGSGLATTEWTSPPTVMARIVSRARVNARHAPQRQGALRAVERSIWHPAGADGDSSSGELVSNTPTSAEERSAAARPRGTMTGVLLRHRRPLPLRLSRQVRQPSKESELPNSFPARPPRSERGPTGTATAADRVARRGRMASEFAEERVSRASATPSARTEQWPSRIEPPPLLVGEASIQSQAPRRGTAVIARALSRDPTQDYRRSPLSKGLSIRRLSPRRHPTVQPQEAIAERQPLPQQVAESVRTNDAPTSGQRSAFGPMRPLSQTVGRAASPTPKRAVVPIERESQVVAPRHGERAVAGDPSPIAQPFQPGGGQRRESEAVIEAPVVPDQPATPTTVATVGRVVRPPTVERAPPQIVGRTARVAAEEPAAQGTFSEQPAERPPLAPTDREWPALALLRPSIRTGSAPSSGQHVETSPMQRAVRALPTLGMGAPLTPRVRRPMERLLQRKLDHVRIHRSPLASEMGAHAFTSGRHIVLSPDQPSVESAQGLPLLAHELVHMGQPLAFKRVSTEGIEQDAHEREALSQEARVQRILREGWPSEPPVAEGGTARATAQSVLPTLVQGAVARRPMDATPAAPAAAADMPARATSPASEMNIEALARDVYRLLRVRLRQEQERHGLYG